jgi:hypothetical protein
MSASTTKKQGPGPSGPSPSGSTYTVATLQTLRVYTGLPEKSTIPVGTQYGSKVPTNGAVKRPDQS